MRVYRLETEEGAGLYFPYTDREDADDFIERVAKINLRTEPCCPAPFMEDAENELDGHKALYGPENVVFGFHEERLMFRWMQKPEAMCAAKEWGLLVGVYDVPEKYVLKTPTQCAFPKHLATLIAQVEPYWSE